MIKTGNVCEMTTAYNRNIMIVRSADSVPDFAVQMTELSPSTELFKKYRKAYHSGKFDEKWFDEIYVPQFIKDLSENSEALSILRQLCVDSRTEDILLCCYCEDERICHRSIIAGILLGMEADIMTDERYLKYYAMFSNLQIFYFL